MKTGLIGIVLGLLVGAAFAPRQVQAAGDESTRIVRALEQIARAVESQDRREVICKCER